METTLTLILAALVFFGGAAVASFSGLAYHRLKSSEPSQGILGTISFPRSHCEHCGSTLGTIDLIPVLGWLIRRGRCKQCGKAIPSIYPLTEFLAGSLSLAIAGLFFPDFKTTGFVLVLFWLLVVIAAIDLAIEVIPDEITTPLLFLGLISSPFETDPMLRICGAAFGWFILHASMAVLQAWKGREGGNGGDAALGAVVGAWFGIFAAPIYLFGFCIVYALHIKLFTKNGEEQGAPCGPAFAVAVIAMMPFQEHILSIYRLTP